jgi:hypothetical protein
LREENGVPAHELAFAIRRRGAALPFKRFAYYGISEQKKHIERAHEDYGTSLTYASHEFPCGCDACMLDDDGGDL